MSCGTATERQCVRRHCDWRRIGTAFLSKLLLLSQTVKHDLMYFSFIRFVFFFGRLKLRPFVSRAMDSIVLSTHLLITKTFLFIYFFLFCAIKKLLTHSLHRNLLQASQKSELVWIGFDGGQQHGIGSFPRCCLFCSSCHRYTVWQDQLSTSGSIVSPHSKGVNKKWTYTAVSWEHVQLWEPKLQNNKNTFCGTRYLSHCCSLHGTVLLSRR